MPPLTPLSLHTARNSSHMLLATDACPLHSQSMYMGRSQLNGAHALMILLASSLAIALVVAREKMYDPTWIPSLLHSFMFLINLLSTISPSPYLTIAPTTPSFLTLSQSMTPCHEDTSITLYAMSPPPYDIDQGRCLDINKNRDSYERDQ